MAGEILEIEYECPHCYEYVINSFYNSCVRDGNDYIVTCPLCSKDSVVWIYFTANKLESRDN